MYYEVGRQLLTDVLTELLALIKAINLSPGNAGHLMATIHSCIESTGSIQDTGSSISGDTSLQASVITAMFTVTARYT